MPAKQAAGSAVGDDHICHSIVDFSSCPKSHAPTVRCSTEMISLMSNTVLSLPSAHLHAHRYPRDFLSTMMRTSPWGSLADVIKSYTIVNDFLFIPPRPSYSFYPARSSTGAASNADDEPLPTVRCGSESASSSSRLDFLGSGRITDDSEVLLVGGSKRKVVLDRLFVPWEHAHIDTLHSDSSTNSSSSNTLGRKPFSLHGGGFIPLTILKSGEAAQAPPQYVVLYFHGNAADCGRDCCGSAVPLLDLFPGIVVFMEYPGYGLFPGEPSEPAIKCAAERVLQFIFSTSSMAFTPSQLVIASHSIGTGVAMHAARIVTETFSPLISALCQLRPGEQSAFTERYSLKAVILRAPFSSVKAVIDPLTDTRYGGTVAEAQAMLYAMGETFPPDLIHNGVEAYLSTFQRCRAERHLAQVRPTTDDGVTPVGVDTVASSYEEDVADDIPLLFVVGQHLMRQRFPSAETLEYLHEAHAFLHRTPVMVLHGTDDGVIPAYHSVRLCSAAAAAYSRADVQTRNDPLSGRIPHNGRSQPLGSLNDDTSHASDTFAGQSNPRLSRTPLLVNLPRLFIAILSGQDHNNVSGWHLVKRFVDENDFVSGQSHGISHTFLRDVSCGAVPLSKVEAAAAFEAHLLYVASVRSLVTWSIVMLAAWIVAVSAAHFAMSSNPNKLVLVWGCLESFAVVGVAVLTKLTPKYGFGRRNMLLVSNAERKWYLAARLIVYLVVLSFGVLFGMICGFHRSTCPWLTPSDAGFSAVADGAARWTMVSMSVLHIGHIVLMAIRNR